MIAHGELEAFDLKPALPAGACLSLLACAAPFKIRPRVKILWRAVEIYRAAVIKFY